jgi:hypothetical protein
MPSPLANVIKFTGASGKADTSSESHPELQMLCPRRRPIPVPMLTNAESESSQFPLVSHLRKARQTPISATPHEAEPKPRIPSPVRHSET